MPLTPLVVTLPLTAPSEAMVKLPVPEPDVLTGGTSSVPVRLTLTVFPRPIMLFIWAQAASESAATRISSRFMHPPLG